MKIPILLLASVMAVTGCGPRQSTTPSQAGFDAGAARDTVLQELDQIHAMILTNTPERLRAEYKAAELKRPMQVELTFRDGRVAAVNYIPQ